MARIGIRELRQHASRYVERVRAGETIDVTLRGLVVARLVPPAGDGWDQLVRAGRVRAATGDLGSVAPLEASVDLADALARVRGAGGR